MCLSDTAIAPLCVVTTCINTHQHNFTMSPIMFQVYVWHSHSFVLWRRRLLSHSSDLSLIVLCSGPSSDQMWQPSPLQSAHISKKITSCSLLPCSAIILQLKSCRELEAKWMLWRMLMWVEWEHCLPLARGATACALNIHFKEAFSCFLKQFSPVRWYLLGDIWIKHEIQHTELVRFIVFVYQIKVAAPFFLCYCCIC